jgi:uncharacterized phage-associated protein
MKWEPLDPRSVANFIITLAREDQKPITNLSLQKILYFINGLFIGRFEENLVSGFFEAWRFGPVHPMLYEAFKDFGPNPITSFAYRVDLMTGHRSKVEIPEDPHLQSLLKDFARPYLSMSPGRLVDLSHSKDSPWDVLTKTSIGGERKFGLRITDELIKERFKFHKVAIAENPRIGEPNEESPPS